jgi:hypothetical protein
LQDERFSFVAEETREAYTIRLPQRAAAHIDKRAVSLGITPTALIQSLVMRQFEKGANGQSGPDHDLLERLGMKLDALRKTAEQLERAEGERYGQLLFEVVKTRAALFHSLDHNVDAAQVDEIIEAAEKTARQYLARLAGTEHVKQ